MMKTYEGKTEDEVVQTACLDLGVTPDQLTYEVIEEKKGLFSKKVVIECYTQSMIQEYLENFVRKTLSNMEFTVETVTAIVAVLPFAVLAVTFAVPSAIA